MSYHNIKTSYADKTQYEIMQIILKGKRIDIEKNKMHFNFELSRLIDIFGYKIRSGYYDMYINNDKNAIIKEHMKSYSSTIHYGTPVNNRTTDKICQNNLKSQINKYINSNHKERAQQYAEMYKKRCFVKKKKKK